MKIKAIQDTLLAYLALLTNTWLTDVTYVRTYRPTDGPTEPLEDASQNEINCAILILIYADRIHGHTIIGKKRG